MKGDVQAVPSSLERMEMEDEAQERELDALVSSTEFGRMVERFHSSTGLRLQAFDLESRPLTPVEDYPTYCRILQERKACPLYYDRAFLRRDEETIGVCAAGVGHFIAPIRDEKQEQTGAVIGPAVKFAPNPVEELAELAFKIKVFPDELIRAADEVQEHDKERLLGAGELVSVGLNLLTEMQAKERVAHALRTLQTRIAESNSQMLCQHMVEAVIGLARADFGLVLLMDEVGGELASGFDQPATDHLVEAHRRLLDGIAEWIKHAERPVTVPDISKSAWCRHLTQDTVGQGSVIGLPIPVADGKSAFGAIAVGYDRPREDLAEPLSTLTAFVSEGLYAIVMGRKLIQAQQSTLLDPQSGAYNSRYLENLLEREISRAARYGHNLAIVLLDIEAFEPLRGRVGEEGLGRLLRELVAVVQAKTRKINSLARLRDSTFCLVIPEADRAVAVRTGDRLRKHIEEHPFALNGAGQIVRLHIAVGYGASEKGKDDRTALLTQAEESLAAAIDERHISGFKV